MKTTGAIFKRFMNDGSAWYPGAYIEDAVIWVNGEKRDDESDGIVLGTIPDDAIVEVDQSRGYIFGGVLDTEPSDGPVLLASALGDWLRKNGLEPIQYAESQPTADDMLVWSENHLSALRETPSDENKFVMSWLDNDGVLRETFGNSLKQCIASAMKHQQDVWPKN